MVETTVAPPKSAIEDAVQQIICAGLAGADAKELISRFADVAGDLEIPLRRVNIGSDILDPVMQARNITWRPDRFEVNEYPRVTSRSSEDWLASPVKYLLESNDDTLSFPLPSPEADRFPIMAQFVAEGFTGYHAARIRFDTTKRFGGIEGLLMSVCTGEPGGFSETQIATLNRLFPSFGLAFLSLLKSESAKRALETYLGRTPAKRVLKGSMSRSQPESLNAIIWFSDIIAFTKTTEDLDQEQVIEFLNAHAEETVEAVENHGGEVMKFVGDGILAVFPGGADDIGSADAALEAAVMLDRRLASMRSARKAAGLLTAQVAISLHVGEVLYGNFGGPKRLDFTVLGNAVNEASRINALSRSLDQRLLASDAFVMRLLFHRERMVSVGRYALRGVGNPRHLFTVEPEPFPLMTEFSG